MDPKSKEFYDFQDKIIIIIVDLNDTSDAHNSGLALLRGERTAADGNDEADLGHILVGTATGSV